VWGDDNVAISFPSLGDAATIRLKSDSEGNFAPFLLASTPYEIAVFDPKTDLIAHGQGVTAQSGSPTDLTSTPTFESSTAATTGLDGLPDDVAFVLNADPTTADNFVPGISDLTALQEELINSTFLASTTGVVASLALDGQAQSIVLAGSTTNSSSQTAYIATRGYGLAIVDATNFQSPTVRSPIQVSGDATGVGVDNMLQLAAVADGTGGLQIIDVADPTNPTIEESVPIDATAVQVFEGIAYANDSGKLDEIDLATGDLLRKLRLGGAAITSIARDGTMLYTMDSSDRLTAIDASSGLMVEEGSITLSQGGGNITVANGVAYVPTQDVFSGGFSTVDVSDPTNLTLWRRNRQ
jgi:hypothetical protein